MRHRAVHAEEGVGAGHARDCSGVVDLLSRLFVSGRIGGLQVPEEEPCSPHGERHREVGGPDGDGGLDGLHEADEAGVRNEALGQGLGVASVHDADVGHEPVAAERVLHALVGDCREGRDLGAGARGRGDGDESADLPGDVREHGGAVAQLQEGGGQLLEASLRVLVEEADQLRGVQRAASTEGDDGVGAKALASLGASNNSL
mmetsp:Transcript_17834/g.56213  ORF Transcript_17834/g.56213 Transcript_17834/m.56213 type:complete len:203 (-) Transcript_17834:939-1547(-)